ncbi:MAG: hypothetical protein ACKOET_18225 [Verrucomicrobiota bacterium]
MTRPVSRLDGRRGLVVSRRVVRVLVLSDLHHASAGEQARAGLEETVVRSSVGRMLLRFHRQRIWLAHPHRQNHRWRAIVAREPGPDLVVANGDFCLDSAFVGVADEAACISARECLAGLSAAYGGRLHRTVGDHDLGKKSLLGEAGGPRRLSLERCAGELGFQRAWRLDVGSRSLVGVTSTLAAWPLFAAEALLEEREWWEGEHRRHLAEVEALFAGLAGDRRILLFCHDPSALPFLAELPSVRARLGQVEHTLLGHLHSPAILSLANRLAGLPAIPWLGTSVRRYSTALRRARAWKAFRPVLCPSPAGIQLLKDGGYLVLEGDPEGREPWRVGRRHLRWDSLSADADPPPG